EIGIKHNLESIDILNDDGTLNEKAEVLIGEDRFEARKKIIPMLEESGSMVKMEDYTNKVGRSERTDAVIEPKLSMQWFLKMQDLSKPALDAVMNDTIKLYPAKFKNTYRHWMENVKDWCISRQLWWGQQIPVFYINDTNDYVVAKTIEEAVELAREKTGDNSIGADNLKQDEDVMDTWFSSWLWPISVFDGIRNPDNEDIKYYYPTSDLITAPDILFFWVARMIIAGYEYRDIFPYKNVYLTGMVRDKQRRKMSKSLGNSPDPLDLIDKYGADGVRVGMLLCSPAGGDLLFDESLTEQGRNFANKIWNAFRLVKGWSVEEKEQPEYAKVAVEWFENKFNEVAKNMESLYEGYKLSEALMAVYKLFWDEFSGWYLEMVKPDYQTSIDKVTYDATVGFFDKMLHVLHPFMPFITEEIWHYIEERDDNECLMVSLMPGLKKADEKLLLEAEKAKEVISFIRNTRKEKQLPNKEKIELKIKADNYNESFKSVIARLGFLESIEMVTEKPEGAVSYITKDGEFFLPLGDLVDSEEEIKKLEEELKYTKGFLQSVTKKLANERFVQNAPEKVVETERKKQADAETKIAALEEQIKALSS
ncbi:MAG: class I tRNA ligase family protein, partial [Bacteroidales bacterium]|nr:class I tRNA ligase family protein [Bacteroidales bacterium]